MGRKSINILEEEGVAEEVRKYPCLYDKTLSEYKDKLAKRNAWKKVEEMLGMEEGIIFLLISCFHKVRYA